MNTTEQKKIFHSFFLSIVIVLIYFQSSGAEIPPIGKFLSDVFKDSTITEQEYYAALKAADERTFEQNFEVYFLLLLTQEQRNEYVSFKTFLEKKVYIQNYWKASNPNPLLPENDWLLEFNRRIQYAKENFRRTNEPYFDDRGKYYIKYGKPHRRFEDPGGIQRVKFTNNERARRLLSLRSPVNYSTIANETWSYENVSHGFVVHFVKEGISFREVESLMEILDDKRAIQKAIPTFSGNPLFKGDPNMIYWLWGDMVKQRLSISPTLAQAAGKVNFVEESITLSGKGAWQLDGLPQVTLRNRANELIADIKYARSTSPSAAHDPIQAENKLTFFDQLSQYRGPNGKTRIEIAMLVPFKKNLVKKVKKSSMDTLNMAYSGMLRDVNFDPVIKNQSISAIMMKSVAQEKLPNAVGKFMLVAHPQNAELTLQVAEKQNDKIGFYRQPIKIRDFSGKALMVSDVQLYYEVKSENEKKTLPTVRLDNIPVSPYPFKQISRKKPPFFYFEIYNIRSAGIKENLQISYRIIALKKSTSIIHSLKNILSGSDKSSISVLVTRSVTGENMQELIEFDFKNVKKGRHLLEVTVSDPQDSTLKAVSLKELVVGK